MKHIDADKLIAEIERLKQENEISDNKEHAQYELDVACGYDMACEKILSISTSLQQEQPEDTEKQKPVVQWPNLSNCKHDCKTCFAKCFYRKEQNKEQQPEVDLNLEREIQLWLTKLRNRPTSDELREFATHFYELGLNARKKE